MLKEEEENDEMRFTGHLLGDRVVQAVRLALHHIEHILLADEDDEDPNSLQRKVHILDKLDIYCKLHILDKMDIYCQLDKLDPKLDICILFT